MTWTGELRPVSTKIAFYVHWRPEDGPLRWKAVSTEYFKPNENNNTRKTVACGFPNLMCNRLYSLLVRDARIRQFIRPVKINIWPLAERAFQRAQ